jgi:transcriptional regulator with XRE-family HTH domain
MQDDLIIQISNQIKEKRKERRITIQELADRAKVSKGLISQIENNRTIPSLQVLMNIINSLNLNLQEFFNGIESANHSSSRVQIKRRDEYHPFEKEHAKGFMYHRIMTRNIRNLPIDIVLLELEPGANRTTTVKTDAYEYKYIIKGEVVYNIQGKTHVLREGDSLFFDGRQGHKPMNIGEEKALILVVYFFMGRDVE